MDIDRDKAQAIYYAYLSLANLLELAGDAQEQLENSVRLNISHFGFLLDCVNTALYEVLGEY